MNFDLQEFGKRLKAARKARKITQEKLAELASLNPRTVQKIEAGEVDILLTTILRLQRGLGCPIDELFGTAAEQAVICQIQQLRKGR